MAEPQKHTIDGMEYTFTYLTGRPAVKLATKLIKKMLGPLGLALNSLDMKKIGDLELKIGDSFTKLAENLDEDESVEVIEQLLALVLMEKGIVASLDVLHQHKGLKHTMKVVAKSFEVNYSDFFEELRGKVSSLLRGMNREGVTRSGSSGGSSSQK